MPFHNHPTPVGMIEQSQVAPPDWLECDGSAIPREDYEQLFLAIAETYGAGDGETTFNLPLNPGYIIRAYP